jgi:hypothetical protein
MSGTTIILFSVSTGKFLQFSLKVSDINEKKILVVAADFFSLASKVLYMSSSFGLL